LDESVKFRGKLKVAVRAIDLVYRLAYNSDGVAFKIGRRQGARRAHISIDT
jgi:hypothetical protein